MRKPSVYLYLLLIILLIVCVFFTFAKQFHSSASKEANPYIKWMDFNVTASALRDTAKLDIQSHQPGYTGTVYNWTELLACLACKNGNSFQNYTTKDLQEVLSLLENTSIEDISYEMSYYDYYYACFEAVLSNFIGEYALQKTDGSYEKQYGVKAFSPIAQNYSFSHYDDFGASRSYGFKRKHLGNDLMGSIGTPIIAIESGYVEAIGWNQYGGWRIGIRSFDKQRYYYYAHLRKDHPFAEDLQEGDIVKAGDVIGYLGMTGYSTTENVNNINVPHLHFGMQIIFDESQKEGNNEIWIDVYSLIEFLMPYRSAVQMDNSETRDYARCYDFIDEALPD